MIGSGFVLHVVRNPYYYVLNNGSAPCGGCADDAALLRLSALRDRLAARGVTLRSDEILSARDEGRR